MVAASFQSQSDSESHVSLFSPQELRQQALPPSERDFQVCEEVVIGGASTRAAAAMFGVSQTRKRRFSRRYVRSPSSGRTFSIRRRWMAGGRRSSR